jgi:hypothetical protein
MGYGTAKLFTAVAIAAALDFTPLYYDDATAQVEPPQILSGGVSPASTDHMMQEQKYCRLKLVFTQPDGVYLENVTVKVRDHEGQTVARTKSAGPILLMTLSPGSYTVISSLNGNKVTEKVMARAFRLETYYVRLPSHDVKVIE